MKSKPADPNTHRRASALVYAAMNGDEMAAEKFDVHAATIKRWRKAIDTDDDLAELVREKAAEFDRVWRDDLEETMASVMGAIREATGKLDLSKATALSALNESLSVLAEYQITQQMLAVRAGTSQENRIEGKAIKSLGPTDAVYVEE